MVSLHATSRGAATLLALITLVEGTAFYSAVDRCPELCIAGADSNSWTVYDGVKHLPWCNQTMLVDFAIYNPLNDTDSHSSIYACTTKDIPQALSKVAKTTAKSYQAKGEVQLITTDASDVDIMKEDALGAIEHLQDYLSNNDSGKPVAFGYSRTAAVGVYLGTGIQTHDAASTLLQKILDQVQSQTVITKSLLQLCGSDRDSNSVFGVVIDSVSNLASIQDAVRSWSDAECATGYEGKETRTNVNVLMKEPIHTAISNGILSTIKEAHANTQRGLEARGDCRAIQVQSGQYCPTLATACGISGAEFTKYNPAKDFCAKLQPGQWVCCSSGTVPDKSPKPKADGSCFSYVVQADDNCSKLAAANGITAAQIKDFNKNTWGFTGCDPLNKGVNMCLSKGDPPMPAPMSNAICGPQKPDTKKPTDGTKLADVNPCPLNACCNIWGQCGTTSDFCTILKSASGAPGTSAPGKNGCISHCGTDIVNNGGAPASFISLAYFEAWNREGRSCLRMDVSQINSGGKETYSHIHFAFATITTDWKVDLTKVQAQFDKFKKMTTKAKKILSFGGWSFSTDADSYPIFRNVVTKENRQAFANNVVSFIKDNNLDGVDFDWEYPGADIKGIPPGSKDDGKNYLEFLHMVRDALPSGKTLSIAAPASYWYLKGFPIKEMAPVLDYIVYMTYDLHGQWDYGSKWSNPDCANGNCLRSHVNLTETLNSLSMITKAGVPAAKIVTGVASYGRSFKMTKAGCTGIECTFVGPESAAEKGPCTDTAGYISHAEITSIVAKGGSLNARDGGVKMWFDEESHSNMLVYNDVQWVAYMDPKTKADRTDKYKKLNLGGTTDWAVDLQTYQSPEECPKTDADCYKNQYQNPSKDGVNWRKLTCENEWVKNAMRNQTDRWFGLGADAAWKDATDSWKAAPHQGGFNFSQAISFFFNGDEGMNCAVMADSNKCHGAYHCDDFKDTGAAAYFIMNSITSIEGALLNFYNAIYHMEVTVNTAISDFIDDFAPMDSDPDWLKITIDLVSMGFALAAAPTWNSWLKNTPYFLKQNGNTLGTMKDSVNGMVSNSMTLIKDGQVAGAALATQDTLLSTLSQATQAWASTVDALNKKLFDGSDSSIKMLGDMMADGALLENPSVLSDQDILVYLERALFSRLIPSAWQLSSQKPFILDAGVPCGTVDPTIEYLEKDVADKTWACAGNKLYYLVVLKGNAATCTTGREGFCKHNYYSAPAGIDKLDGKLWGGVKLEDFVVGGVNGYHSNGDKNGWKSADPSDTKMASTLYDLGIRSPGVVGIPVCDTKTALQNWIDAERFGSHENYPCVPLDVVVPP
ncbi:hypothetical protein VE02_08437 [Pseudogymnoascus sp. 03VT05]|nr:hypothetical protein VE02_08437 [Pseudogymnoascus sp. 03VT05]